MSDLDSFDIEQDPHETRSLAGHGQTPPGRGKVIVAVAIVLVVVLAAGYYFFFVRNGEPEPAEETATRTTADLPVAAPDPEPERGDLVFDGPLPELDGSNRAVGAIISQLSSHPRLLRWLATPDLIRTFAATVENIASGTNPATHLSFLDPGSQFRVRSEQDGLHTDASNHRRYDLVTAVFVSVDPEAAAAAYRHLRPLIEEAFVELGYPGQAFEPSLEKAFANLLAIPIPPDDPLLVKGVETFNYADPRLESLSPLAKQLLRMGPGNARRIQNQLRHLANALGMDPWVDPSTGPGRLKVTPCPRIWTRFRGSRPRGAVNSPLQAACSQISR